MRIYGIDFTSRPSRRKPITCLCANLTGCHLVTNTLLEWQDFEGFEQALRNSGPWLAGIDFPFGLPRRFLENIGWPTQWTDYVDRVGAMSREAFRRVLDDYRSGRAAGDREHRRRTDIAAGAISPQKLYGTPVGLMFFEGAPRLKNAGVHIPGLLPGDPARIVVEAYPGLLARELVGRRSYKQDSRSKQTSAQARVRAEILQALTESDASVFGLTIEAPADLIDDPGGDRLDALLCAVQAAWAWQQRGQAFGMPSSTDPAEGWIASPSLR